MAEEHVEVTVVVRIGLLVESLGFKTLERLTVRRWGQQC